MHGADGAAELARFAQRAGVANLGDRLVDAVGRDLRRLDVEIARIAAWSK